MTPLKSLIFLAIGLLMSYTPALAADSVDWRMGHGPVYEAGPGTPVVGKRWSMGSVKDDVQFALHLDVSPDMLKGNWYGDIRSSERFYIKTYLLDADGKKYILKLEDVRAYGPDAEYGGWKTGPATTDVQALRFGFTREELLSLKPFKSLIINYASFETPDETTDILFDLDSYTQKLAELDASIKAAGGDAFLLTDKEVKNMPLNALPPVHQNKWKTGLADVSTQLSVQLGDLMTLSVNQINEKVDAHKEAIREAAKAAKRAEHQAIYDQEPDWLDLNLCPKPDVEYCNHVGMLAYENSIMFDNGRLDYGKVKGVVWRSKGSIVRIYGGSIDLGIEPEIYRTETAGYYYVTKNDKGHLSIRPSDGLMVE